MGGKHTSFNVIFREEMGPLSDQGLRTVTALFEEICYQNTQRCSTHKIKTRRQRHHWRWLKYNLYEPQTADSSQISGAQH